MHAIIERKKIKNMDHYTCQSPRSNVIMGDSDFVVWSTGWMSLVPQPQLLVLTVLKASVSERLAAMFSKLWRIYETVVSCNLQEVAHLTVGCFSVSLQMNAQRKPGKGPHNFSISHLNFFYVIGFKF